MAAGLFCIMRVSFAAAQNAEKAQAFLYNAQGEEAGVVSFSQVPEGVKVGVEITNLPAGKHALHVHEKGECVAPDFKSSGGHFNPENAHHGFLNPQGPHAGDLPNIEVKSDGTAEASFITGRLTLERGKSNSILKADGTAVVIHAEPDDYLSDPAGMGGARIACGVIVAETEE